MAIVAAACSSPRPEPAGKPDEPDLRVQIVDLYGLHRVKEAEVRAALTVTEGDAVSLAGDARPAALDESERRLALVPGVVRIHLNLVCCEAGGGILYVGIEERGTTQLRFREAPSGVVRLSHEIVEAGDEYSVALLAAIQRGDAAEDVSQGHALASDKASRTLQQRFIEFAREVAPLRDVLRQSSDAEHRALAAQVLGYAQAKQEVVGDLVYAMSDPAADVRNNAMRALWVMASAVSSSKAPWRIPMEPFVGMLNSFVWTDRNKASNALMELTESREPAVLAMLRNQAVPSLVEMARWKSEGHAMAAFVILGRISGRSDEEIHAAWTDGRRGDIIKAALQLQ